MKKQIIFTALTLMSLSGLYAGSGSFWGGFAAGTVSGFVGNEIAHHAHHPRREVVVHHPIKYIEVERPQYIEVKRIKTEPSCQNSVDLKEQKRLLEVENQRLQRKVSTLNNELDSTQADNCELNRKLSKLENKLADATIENKDLTKKIESLSSKIEKLEDSINRINQKARKT
jgi:predicted nuclease with TOPRIM domain